MTDGRTDGHVVVAKTRYSVYAVAHKKSPAIPEIHFCRTSGKIGHVVVSSDDVFVMVCGHLSCLLDYDAVGRIH